MKPIIAKAVEVFRQHPDANHEQTVELLTAAVGDADLAERLMEFVPLAFARVAYDYSGAQFRDIFCRSLGNGKFSHFCPLSSEPLWEPAIKMAWEEQSMEISDEDRIAVMSSSWLYRTVEQARANGQRLESANFSHSIFLRPAPMPCQRKPWWQFWK